jgi:hypothetical protein
MVMSNLSSQVQVDYTLSIMVCIALSSIIFRRIVRPFFNIPEPTGGKMTILDPESTLAILHNLGLDFLTYTGSFYTLIMLYLINVDNLTHMLSIDLSTLDVGVLQQVLGRLKFLIQIHELIFNVFSNIVRMDDIFNLNFNYSPESLEETIRTIGNRLYRVYRLIERELNIDDSDLPQH